MSDSERRNEGPYEVGSWREWAHHVLQEMKRLDACNSTIKQQIVEVQSKVEAEIMRLRVEQAKLQVKSGVWGGIGAMIPILVGILIWALTK